MKQYFLGNWSDKKDVAEDFQIALEEFDKAKILLAWYGYGDYDGSAFVLFEHDGKLYEVNGGHCSCYGLEGQWSPEEVTASELEHRITKGDLGKESYYNEGVFVEEIAKLLKLYKQRQARKS